MTCEHQNFSADVDVHRLSDVDDGPITAFRASVRIECADCGEPFRFIGDYPTGLLARQVTRDVRALELSAPIRPASKPPGWGENVNGFVVTYTGPSPSGGN